MSKEPPGTTFTHTPPINSLSKQEVLMGERLDIQLDDMRFSAKAWGNPKGSPILALHGWLDNCASFDYLAPLINDCYIVCVDTAGHGLSSHRAHMSAYGIWLDVGDIFRIADQLNWQSFSLMGHSRGAMIAFLAAGTFPERIKHLILLEGIAPSVIEASAAPARLAESITTVTASSLRSVRYYKTFDDAVQARVKGIFPISPADARTLATYGVVEAVEGYTWRYDAKLMAVTELGMTIEQVEAFYQNISADCALFLAREGLIVKEPFLMQWIKTHTKLNVHTLDGDHHFHMHAQSALASEIINEVMKK